MATGYPGNINTYVPTLDISGNLQVGFSRNIKDFPLNSYINLTKVKAPRGLYLYFNPLDVARIRLNNANGPRWAPGTLRPTGFQNTRGFEYKEFTTVRYAHPTTLDQQAVDVAEWDVQKKHSEDLAQEAMTFRTFIANQTLLSTANYPAAHVFTATTAGGGFLDGGTTADPRIKKAFDYAARQIQKATMGRIKHGDLTVVMNSNTALLLSNSRELREYVMQQESAQKNITMDDSNYNAKYGLPKKLYTYNIAVEDTFYNGYNRGNASEVGAPTFEDNSIMVVTRQGDLESSGPESPSYSTLHLMMYEDMTVETEQDRWNRLLQLSVVDNFVPVVVAGVSACKITNIFS